MNRNLAFKIGLGVSVLVGVGVTLVLTLLTTLHCTDGDGGAPYVAQDSDQEAFCSATGDGIGLGLVALIGVVALAWLAWRRWQLVAAGGTLAIPILLLVAAAAFPVPLAVIYNVPSDHCSDQEQASYDAWVYSHGRERTPYECARY